ncbi:MAG: SMC-Scp complex subunit ScpB [Candidatus Colwellbacteria bacterium]|nr:SMC-Scp complex subunit ScpB [Candidatus Colwellbacteria bacterium]
MADNDLTKKLQALLFIYGEPTKISKLAEATGAPEQQVKESLEGLKSSLQESGSGLDLMLSEDEAMLTTAAEVGETVKGAIKEELDSQLTPASLETLAIIAYLGPVSRAVIEYIRGVNSSFMLRNLMVRGLITKDGSHRTPEYKVTFDFLRHMGVDSPEKLPQYQEYKEKVRQLMETSNNEQT